MKTKLIASAIALSALLQGCMTAAVVTVVGGAAVVNDNRSLGKLIDDQKIELDAHAKLSENEGLSDNTNIQVVSVNGKVLMLVKQKIIF
jgi:osmotically-inducible protein OsmY